MHQVSLYKNLRSKEDSDKRRKGKLSFVGCHIKIGQLEFWAITLGCDCDPSLGAARALAVEPTCVSILRQLETAAFPQLIITSLSSASSKRNRKHNLSLALPAHTGEGGRPSTEFQAIIFISPEWIYLDPGQSHPWAYRHTTGSATASKQSKICVGPILSSGIICILVGLCTWDLALLMLALN